jgi:hypothetical protein
LTSTEACIHHWIIEAQKPSNAAGRCKRCGAERMFAGNAPPDMSNIMRRYPKGTIPKGQLIVTNEQRQGHAAKQA